MLYIESGGVKWLQYPYGWRGNIFKVPLPLQIHMPFLRNHKNTIVAPYCLPKSTRFMGPFSNVTQILLFYMKNKPILGSKKSMRKKIDI